MSHLYSQWEFKNQSGAFSTINNAAASGVVINMFFCPSSPMSKGPPTRQAGSTYASYVSISGAADAYPTSTIVPGFTETRLNNWPCGGLISGGGAMFPNGMINFNNISDGTSNTMAISEQSNFVTDNAGVKQEWRASQTWGWYLGVKSAGVPPNFDNGGSDNRQPNQTTIRYQINYKPAGGWTNDVAGMGVGLPAGTNCVGANTPLSSTHTGGVNAVMCDGSVRFIRETTPLKVLAQLAIRDDGVPLPD